MRSSDGSPLPPAVGPTARRPGRDSIVKETGDDRTALGGTSRAGAARRRILPLLVFLGFVVVLAELTAKAEVFDVIAARAGIVAGGNYAVLFVLCVGLASATTVFLNLDTTAVLL